MNENLRIYDPHIHAAPTSEDLNRCVADALEFLTQAGIVGANVLVIRNAVLGYYHDALYLYLKTLYPERFSVYGGLATGLPGCGTDAADCLAQVKEMREAGFDGLKLWVNDSTKDSWGFELDGKPLEPVWDYLEETQFPVLIHVGNTVNWPEGSLAGERSKRFGRRIEENNEPLYSRVEQILQRHPRLNLLLPHLYFMCEDGPRLAALMEAHPSLKIDICPGTAMFCFMSRDTTFWRAFFEKYQDRILFGTDNHIERPGAGEQVRQVRLFLETDGTYPVRFFGNDDWGFDYTGIGPLPDEILNKIYRTNFEKLRGPIAKVDPTKAVRWLEKELPIMERLEARAVPKYSETITRQVIARFREMESVG